MNRRVQWVILFSTLICCLTILVDNYILPVKVHPEICRNLTDLERPFNRLQKEYYFIHLDGHNYGIDKSFFDQVDIGGTVFFGKSLLFKANKFIESDKSGLVRRCDIGFIDNSGDMFLGFTILTTIAFMIFYDRVPYNDGKKYLTYFLALMSILILALHIAGSLDFLP